MSAVFLAVLFGVLVSSGVYSCTDGELRPYPHTCHSYLECVGGGYTKRDCPLFKYHFDVNTMSCVFAHANCSRVECVEESKVEDPEGQGASYILCKGGEEVVEKCKNGTRFDPRCRHCTEDFRCLDGRRVYRNCKDYLECVNNVWLPKRCPLWQKMDEVTLQCKLWGAACTDV